MAWHVTPVTNLPSILKGGLIPAIGPLSARLGEARPAVHMFSGFDHLQDGWGWVETEFDEDAPLAVLHVSGDYETSHHGPAWIEHEAAIGPDLITLVSRDFGNMKDWAGLAALDRVASPLQDVESFRATRVEMSAKDFGEMVGDALWENEDDLQFLVYAGSFWIEIGKDGRHALDLEREEWVTGGDETLDTLEGRLFAWALEQRAPSEEPDLSGSPDLG